MYKLPVSRCAFGTLEKQLSKSKCFGGDNRFQLDWGHKLFKVTQNGTLFICRLLGQSPKALQR